MTAGPRGEYASPAPRLAPSVRSAVVLGELAGLSPRATTRDPSVKATSGIEVASSFELFEKRGSIFVGQDQIGTRSTGDAQLVSKPTGLDAVEIVVPSGHDGLVQPVQMFLSPGPRELDVQELLETRTHGDQFSAGTLVPAANSSLEDSRALTRVRQCARVVDPLTGVARMPPRPESATCNPAPRSVPPKPVRSRRRRRACCGRCRLRSQSYDLRVHR